MHRWQPLHWVWFSAATLAASLHDQAIETRAALNPGLRPLIIMCLLARPADCSGPPSAHRMNHGVLQRSGPAQLPAPAPNHANLQALGFHELGAVQASSAASAASTRPTGLAASRAGTARYLGRVHPTTKYRRDTSITDPSLGFRNPRPVPGSFFSSADKTDIGVDRIPRSHPPPERRPSFVSPTSTPWLILPLYVRFLPSPPHRPATPLNIIAICILSFVPFVCLPACLSV
jgi:hypothetical protein